MIEPLIYSYRDDEARAQMARYWCQRQYNGDTSPATMQRIKEDLESLNERGLAYLWREAGGEQPLVERLPDDYDPWR